MSKAFYKNLGNELMSQDINKMICISMNSSFSVFMKMTLSFREVKNKVLRENDAKNFFPFWSKYRL